MKKVTYTYGLKKINSYYNDLEKDYKNFVEKAEDLDSWTIKDRCTKVFWNKFKAGGISVKDFKAYVIKRYMAEVEHNRARDVKRLDLMKAAPEIKAIELNVYWTKSRTWGANPRAEIYVMTKEGTERYESSSIGGCGYDKRSAATAQALNQSNAVLAALLDLSRRESKKGVEKTYGYYNNSLPIFEGGVGFCSHSNILEAIGLKAEVLNERAKNYDFYSFKKKGSK